MRKLTLSAMLLTMAAMLAPCGLSAAQAEKAPAPPPQIYSVHYNISELANGKRINSRGYDLMIAEPGPLGGSAIGRIRVGNQVPITFGTGAKGIITNTQFQYHNVGMHIDCSLLHAAAPAGRVLLSTSIVWQSIAGKGTSTGEPILRSLEFSGPALVPLGKPTIIGKVDDVTSDHEYEIEVTVKKVE